MVKVLYSTRDLRKWPSAAIPGPLPSPKKLQSRSVQDRRDQGWQVGCRAVALAGNIGVAVRTTLVWISRDLPLGAGRGCFGHRAGGLSGLDESGYVPAGGVDDPQ